MKFRAALCSGFFGLRVEFFLNGFNRVSGHQAFFTSLIRNTIISILGIRHSLIKEYIKEHIRNISFINDKKLTFLNPFSISHFCKS